MTEGPLRVQIVGGAGPRETAAIMAAMARIAEEQGWALSLPATRPEQGSWVLSGRPTPVESPFLHRRPPPARGWAVAGDES